MDNQNPRSESPSPEKKAKTLESYCRNLSAVTDGIEFVMMDIRHTPGASGYTYYFTVNDTPRFKFFSIGLFEAMPFQYFREEIESYLDWCKTQPDTRNRKFGDPVMWGSKLAR